MRHFFTFVSLFSLIALSGCQNHSSSSETMKPSSRYSTEARHSDSYGRVNNIDVVRTSSNTSGGGAVLGAVLGGVLGNQVGRGTGRAAATGAGAIGGAVLGNSLEKRNQNGGEVYRVTVQFENGNQAQFDYQAIGDLRVGDRVKVESGELIRI